MAWFRRKRDEVPLATPTQLTAVQPEPDAGGDPIDDFWQWWSHGGAGEVGTALQANDALTVVGLLTARLNRVHEDLVWELVPGTAGSAHALVVTAAGDPRLRSIARRWVNRAPEADLHWCFADGRLPVGDLSERRVAIAGQSVELAEARIAAVIDGAQVDVEVFHPAMPGLDRAARRALCSLVVTNALGEPTTDVWIRYVDAASTVPDAAMTLETFRGLVGRLAANYPLSGPRRVWWVTRRLDWDGEFFIRRQQPLRAAGRPELDTHIRVAVPYPGDPDRDGFHDPGTSARMGIYEESLEAALGEHGQLIATETRPGRRILHLYADSTTDALERVRAATPAWSDGTAVLDVTFDPAWEAVGHLL